MKNTLLFIFCSLFSFFSFSQKKDALVGVWLEEEGQSEIEIYAVNTSEGTKYEGKIIWLKEPLRENGEVKLDDKNPNPKLRNQTILGLIIMKDLKFKKPYNWHDGSIYDARSGKTYSLEINMPNINILKLRGYIGVSLIGKTTVWKRVK
tara:strand:+ start:55 stop:501 length:447 start_codon:yes stop_codon:yes gene_type:complete